MRSWTGRQALVGVVYLGLIFVLISCMFSFVTAYLPHSVATRVSHNSEGYVIALIVLPWVQFARERLFGRRSEWPVTIIAGAVSVIIGILLILSSLPSPIRTLNEGFIAAGLLLPYVQLRRPVRWTLPVAVAVLAVLIATVFDQNSEVTDLAEVWGGLVLLPLTFDVFDRGILDRTAPNRPWLRYAWMTAMVVIPVVVSILVSHHGLTGVPGQVVRYLSRCNEDFIAAFLTTLCLSVILGWTGRGDRRSAASDRSRGALAASQ